MTTVNDFRKTVTYTTPVYAAVGVTDLAVERVREASVRAAAVRVDLDVSALQDKAVALQDKAVKRAEKVAEKVTEQAQQFPALALSQTAEIAGKARETYSELAVRGEKLVKRIRNQKSTKDLFAQAGSTISLGKGAVTTVRKAATETQQAAVATLTTALHEAEAVVGTVTGTVRDEAKATTRTVRKSAPVVRLTGKRTATAAKRTATTAKKSTASVQRATKATATSARKTATKATKTATPKVGD
jgi:heparin binding hemagglutinin HbhA